MDLTTKILINKFKNEKGGGGVTPTGTINITQNGITDVTNYASANVNVSADPGEFNVKMQPTGSATNALAVSIKKVNGVVLKNGTASNLFINCSNLESITNLSSDGNMTQFESMFYGCSKLTGVDLSNVSVSTTSTNMNSMFYGCSSLQSVDLSTWSCNASYMNNMFYNCTNLESVDISKIYGSTSLYNISNCFGNCSKLTTIIFNTAFSIPSRVTSNQTKNMFSGCDSLNNTTLNSILHILAISTGYAGTKTLKHIGLSETQATTCQTLSNWEDASTAGWTTGY